MGIRILTDSTCDLGDDLINKYGIEIIPLHVTIGGRSFIDGVEIHQNELFYIAGRVNELPKTAAPSVGEF
jgi:fatty acid-binding protein DegV